jgi:hypothetical protein
MLLNWLPDHTRDPSSLPDSVERRLAAQGVIAEYAPLFKGMRSRISAVMFLLGPVGENGNAGNGVNLILNKRSAVVRQAGDLCCPGGGVTPLLDRFLARLLTLPCSPLTTWSQWRRWRSDRPVQTRRLAILLGTALREGFEEMRLNPLGVRFLGPLPVERLVVFGREIYPFVGWVGTQRRFHPNWEVEDLVYLPLAQLFDPANYARLHYRFNTADAPLPKGTVGELPCFLHRGSGGSEVLWGATFRITMRFLALAFDFHPPSTAHLPVIERDLDDTYVNGKG